VNLSRIPRGSRFEDLLGREQVQLDAEQLNASIRGAVVMVTGAGGSIGSELVPPGLPLRAGAGSCWSSGSRMRCSRIHREPRGSVFPS